MISRRFITHMYGLGIGIPMAIAMFQSDTKYLNTSDRLARNVRIIECLAAKTDMSTLPADGIKRAAIGWHGINIYPREGEMDGTTLLAVFNSISQTLTFKNPDDQNGADRFAACARENGMLNIIVTRQDNLAPI